MKAREEAEAKAKEKAEAERQRKEREATDSKNHSPSKQPASDTSPAAVDHTKERKPEPAPKTYGRDGKLKYEAVDDPLIDKLKRTAPGLLPFILPMGPGTSRFDATSPVFLSIPCDE